MADAVQLCSEMAALIERQLADLARTHDLLSRQHAYWLQRLADARAGDVAQPVKLRAARGELKAAIMDVLAMAEGGLTLAQIDARLSDRLSHYNRHSISEVLARLRASGVITRHEGVWSLCR